MRYIKVEGDVRVAIYDLNPGGKHTVFFIHGWPLSSAIFEYQTSTLVRYGYRCVSVDLRGFGASDCPAGGYSYDRLARDIHIILRSLDGGPVTLAGFSMGGAIAIRYLSLFGGYKVSRLALLGAAAPSFVQRPDFPYGITREEVDALIEQAYANRPQMCADFGKKLFALDHGAELLSWFKRIGQSAGSISTVKTAESLRDEDLREDMAKVRVPTGIFHGRKDLICPYDLALQQHKQIPGAELFSFENSGHAVFYDELPKFNCEFLHFLQSGHR